MTLRGRSSLARDRVAAYVRLLRRESERRGPIRVIWLIGTIMPVVLWIGGIWVRLRVRSNWSTAGIPSSELPGAFLLAYAGMAVLSLVLLVVIVETARRLRRWSKR